MDGKNTTQRCSRPVSYDVGCRRKLQQCGEAAAAKFSREKRGKKTQFWPAEFFHFFEQDRLLFARVDIGVTEFPTKSAEKEEIKNWV